jgi:hypothetical protein
MCTFLHCSKQPLCLQLQIYFYKGFSMRYHMQFSLYREVSAFVDWFTALHFMGIGAPPAVRRIQILPMSQYARWPMTFGIKGIY